MNKMQLLEKAAEERLELGGHLVLLGEMDGQQIYTVEFDETMNVGVPEAYTWDGEKVDTIRGDHAGLLIASLLSSY